MWYSSFTSSYLLECSSCWGFILFWGYMQCCELALQTVSLWNIWCYLATSLHFIKDTLTFIIKIYFFMLKKLQWKLGCFFLNSWCGCLSTENKHGCLFLCQHLCPDYSRKKRLVCWEKKYQEYTHRYINHTHKTLCL